MSTIRVGIYTRKEIRAVFHGEYKHGEEVISGEKVICEAGWYVPLSEDCSFSLMDVTIGIDFHWERNETQTFKGSLEVMKAKNGELTAVNVLDIEDYLQSVISSEMSATSHMELLKAHAVISRSWALCKIQRSLEGSAFACQESEGKRICWYGSEPHEGFDVCADDHCQRYQGLRAKDHKNAIKAVQETQGEVLCQLGVRSEELGVKEYEICDARFYKCCGGVTEQFETCWEDTHFDYLVKVEDFPKERRVETSLMKCEALNKGERRNDLTTEEGARKWIMSNPDAFCNTSDKKILGQVLNDYDQETIDFYRWKVVYTQDELTALVARHAPQLGKIIDLIPLKRGVSGRIYELNIVGENGSIIIGKELEIRKWLSNSHLYSSAFVVEKEGETFTLYGAGWGHGVGLCQIGAAVMAEKGYTYKEILAHYYPNTHLLSFNLLQS
ncbi:MAG: SpoIID/LytB domain-containing protein [Paludibacteraceae bacterium]|nr:SpoIID/LytB domain-containing protein [Paludibacteraceae bacterium]